MILEDSGDIIKGLGFVTLYSAHLEELIDKCVDTLKQIDATPPKGLLKSPARNKIKYCKKQLDKFEQDNIEIIELKLLMDYILELLECRNEFIHGRIYGQYKKPDILKSGREGVPDHDITSAELFDLANKIFDARGGLLHAVQFGIPRALR